MMESVVKPAVRLSGKLISRLLRFSVICLAISALLIWLTLNKIDIFKNANHPQLSESDYSSLPLEYRLSLEDAYYIRAEDQNINAEAVERDFAAKLAPRHFDSLIEILRYLEVTGQFGLQKGILARLLTPSSVLSRCEMDCWTGNSNISQDNAYNISLFLDAYYYERAKTLHSEGLIWDAFVRIKKLRELSYAIDMPFVNNGYLGTILSSIYSRYTVSGIFLKRQEDWRDGALVNRVFTSLDEYGSEPKDSTSKTGHDLFLIMPGRRELAANCPSEANKLFAAAGANGSSPEIRELARFLMIRAAFTEKEAAITRKSQLKSATICAPMRTDIVDWGYAERVVKTPSLRSDIAETKAAMAH